MRGARLSPAVRFACALGLAALLAAGCSRPAPAPPSASIKLLSAFVMQPASSGSVAAYLMIDNLGPADELLSASTSAGGPVQMLAPVSPGSTAIRTMTRVPVPAHSILKMSPTGLRLLLTDPGPLRTGTNIQLTLVFARAGAVSVAAQVTNSETGGSSYFGP